MSDYKAPQPEIEYVDPDLDLRTYDEAWTVLKHCDTCDNMISLPDRPPPAMWPDFCRDCTDYSSCDCPEGMYPVRHSWKSGKMWNTGKPWRESYIEGVNPDDSTRFAYVCEC